MTWNQPTNQNLKSSKLQQRSFIKNNTQVNDTNIISLLHVENDVY